MITSRYESSPPTPTEIYLRRKRKIGCLIWIVLLIVLALLFWKSCSGPKKYGNIEQHFKYGSIGSDIENGFPVELIKVLPKMFPEYLPQGANSPQKDLTAFGFIAEPGRKLPIGFSLRQRGVPLAGLNCASCHTGVVRSSAGDTGEYVLGMPANQLRLQNFFQFLFDCVADPKFTVENVMREMRENGFRPGPIDRLLYSRLVIPQFQGTLLLRQKQLKQFFNEKHPKWGAGRVDTFNPYKRIQFAEAYAGDPIEEKESIGNSDFPSLWDQRTRADMDLHWDGNNCSVPERNLSASFGAGATRENVDHKSLARIRKWIMDLPAPKFEDYFPDEEIDQEAAKRGAEVYWGNCSVCHDIDHEKYHDKEGAYVGEVDPIDKVRTSGVGKDDPIDKVEPPLVGKVDPIEKIGTSEWRLNSYTEKLQKLQLAYGDGYDWDWTHFHKTNGYANAPLDGIWARAPYLHNGSIPTMWDLLTPEKDRSQEPFLRGHGVFDTKKLGIKTDVNGAGDLPSWKFDVTEKGNQNKGHTGERYGTHLSDEQKWDLIEYLKTL